MGKRKVMKHFKKTKKIMKKPTRSIMSLKGPTLKSRFIIITAKNHFQMENEYKDTAVMIDYSCDSGNFMLSIKITC